MSIRGSRLTEGSNVLLDGFSGGRRSDVSNLDALWRPDFDRRDASVCNFSMLCRGRIGACIMGCN